MPEKQEKTLDEQFHEVSLAFVDAHDFTEFCFTRLDDKITTLDAKVVAIDRKVDALDTRVGSLETKVSSLEVKVTNLDTKVTNLDTKVTNLDTKVTAIDIKVATLATTMDRRFTRNELLLSEVLNEVKRLSSARLRPAGQ